MNYAQQNQISRRSKAMMEQIKALPRGEARQVVMTVTGRLRMTEAEMQMPTVCVVGTFNRFANLADFENAVVQTWKDMA